LTAASLETSCSQSCDWLGHNIGDEGVLSVSRLTKVSFKTGPSHNFDTASLVTVSILRLLTTDSIDSFDLLATGRAAIGRAFEFH